MNVGFWTLKNPRYLKKKIEIDVLRQLETSDAPSVGSSAGALSAHDAPSPSPDTDADMPHLLTLAEAAAQLAAAELEWEQRMQRRERRAPL